MRIVGGGPGIFAKVELSVRATVWNVHDGVDSANARLHGAVWAKAPYAPIKVIKVSNSFFITEKYMFL
jgi:hypothetical protein